MTQVNEAIHDLVHYLDYRAFLADHAGEQRRKNPHWSFGVWAKKMGLSNTATLTRVLQGDRHPGPQLVDGFVKYFRFSAKDAEHFRDLVRLSKTQKDPKLATLLLEKMGRRFANGKVRTVDEQTFQTISRWYCLPIREMVRQRSFKNDCQWIANRFLFHVDAKETEEALFNLKSLGLVDADPVTHTLKIAEGRLNTGDDIANEAVKRHHEEMLDNAKKALRTVDVAEREITAQTLSFSSQNLSKAKQLIREFQDKFSELMEDSLEGDRVFQMQIQFFPLTKKEDTE